MNLQLKGLVELATDSMQNNNDFRNDLLLSYLSTEAVQADPDTFKKFYD